MNKRRIIERVRDELMQIAFKEHYRLFRMARKAREHGCSPALVDDIKQEAWAMYRCYMSKPEQLLDPFASYKYALRD